MIDWKLYDRTNHPELDTMYLVKHTVGVTNAYLDKADNGKIVWVSFAGHVLTGVTHYAEFNMPQ